MYISGQKSVLFLLVAAATQLAAQSSTNTALSVSASSVAWPAPVTLTATVTAGGKSVAPGLVKLCKAAATTCQGSALLAQAQLVPNGTATTTLALPIGTHSVKAVFAGTKTNATSTSNVGIITVTGLRSSSITITASTASPYTLSATVWGNGSQAVTGNVSLVDTSNGNYSFEAALGSSTTESAFVPQSSPTGSSEPIPLVVADFNRDGYPDLAFANISATNGVYTLTIFPSNGPDTYTTPVTVDLPAAFQNPTAITAGDFNNDGIPDLAVAGENSNQVLILFGNGKGGFVTGGSYPTGTGPNSIAVGDFNGDGKIDLAVTNQFSASLTILLGNGEGGFTAAPASPATGSFPYSVAVGDFNNDGKQDLAVANYFGSDVTVLLGNGDGTFTPTTSSPGAGVYPDWVAVGDFNRDGKQDLAVVNQFSKTVTILLGDGKGNFTAAAVSPATGKNPDSVAVGDFNADGIEDLAVANSNDNTVTVLLGKGDGTFPTTQTVPLAVGTAPYSISAADFNDDGLQDFAVAGAGNNTAVIVLNTETTTATATLTGVKVPGGGKHNVDATYPGSSNYGPSTSATVALAGTPIATGLTLNAEPTMIGTGEPVQFTAIISPSLIGRLAPTGTVTFYSGTFVLATVPVANGIAVYNGTFGIEGSAQLSIVSVSATYSGDSNFIGSSSGTAHVRLVSTVGTTTTLRLSSSSIASGTAVTLTAAVASGGNAVTKGSVTFCDGNANFCEDSTVLGTAQLTANGTAVIKLTPTAALRSIKAVFSGAAQFLGSFSGAQKITVTPPASLPTTTSLAISGTPAGYALVATIAGTGPIPGGVATFVDTSNKNLLLGTTTLFAGAPTFVQSTTLPTGNNPESIAVADFNGDGRPDLAVANYSANSISVYVATGNGTFAVKAPAIIGTPGFNAPFKIVAGDFNGDGRSDLAVANVRSGNLTILLGNGDGTFVVKSNPATGSGPISIAVGDFNGDGRQDLAVANNQSRNVTILLGNGDGTFTADPVSPAVGSGSAPFAIVAADFDGDHKLDLAVANEFSNTITILLGNGDGAFSPSSVSPSTGAEPVAIAVGDFNGDGAPDLAVVNFSAFNVSILLNNGQAAFTPGTPLPTGANPQGIVAGDFNSDGVTDLAVTNAIDGSLTLLIGSGQGTFFEQTVPLASGSGPIPIAVGDFNDDGGHDLAVGDVNSNAVRILLNAETGIASVSSIIVPGGGSHQIEAIYAGASPYIGSTSSPVAVTGTPIPTAVFLSAPMVSAGQTVPITATVFPVSADNFTIDGTVSLFNGSTLIGTTTLANGQARFSTTFAAAGAHNLTVTYGGSANFAASNSTAPVYVAPASATSLSVSARSVSSGAVVTLTANVTLGGKPVTQGLVTFLDNSTPLATVNLTTSGSAMLKRVLGIGTHSIKAVFAETSGAQGSSSTAQTVAVTGLKPTTTTLSDSVVSGQYTLTAKVRGAGTQTPSGSISFLNTTANTMLGTATLGTGATMLNFSEANVAVGNGPQAVGMADLNRDGYLDFAVVNATSGTVSILLGNGKGAFTLKSTVPVGGDPAAIALGDFNADGIPDLAVANFGSSNVSILLGNGDGTFTAKSPLVTGVQPIGIAVGDFNLDGKVDVAVANNGSQSVSILLGNGDGTFAVAPSIAGFAVPRGLAVGDFNGDGLPDLAVADYSGANVSILLGNGNGKFVQSATIPAAGLAWPVVVGDFNGDGKLDVAVANAGAGTLTMALGNGNGTFGNPSTIALSSQSQPKGLVAADFNGDGKLDLAVSEFGQNQTVILLGNGNGTFTLQSAAVPAGSQPWSIGVGDFNGDGKPDLAVPNNGSSNLSVLLNSLTTTATATLSGVTISGTANQSIEANYPVVAPYAASTSNILSLPPI